MPKDLADLLDTPSQERLEKVDGVTATPVTPLARAWHEQGHTISVFCLDQSVIEAIRLTGDRIIINVLPKRRFRQSMLDCYRIERILIRDAIMREKPDVLSAQWSYEHALGALDTEIPAVIACHDAPLSCAWISKSLFMTYHLFIAAKVIRKAQGLVCVSPYTASHILKWFRPKCSPQVIPNGLHSDIFSRGERRLGSRRHSRSTFTLCSVGGWGEIKNLKVLLRAFAQVRSRYGSTRLVLFGNGLGSGQEGEKWAQRRKLTEGVDFRGSMPRECIFDFLEQDADMMVHPSLVEAHGMVLTEAMACGVPVIGGRSSGAVPWTLGEGEHGILCNIRSANDVAKTIILAMENDQETARIAGLGWRSAAERFSMEETARRNLVALQAIAVAEPRPIAR